MSKYQNKSMSKNQNKILSDKSVEKDKAFQMKNYR